MSKTRTSWTVHNGLTNSPRLNSNNKNAKPTVAELPVGPSGLSTRTLRTVCQGLADGPWVGCGPSARSTRVAHHTVCLEVNFGLPTMDPRTVRPKEIFLEKLCQKPQILNKPQRPADRPPQGPGLSAPQQKTDFSQDFQRNLFII
jgi:hypothetical protein